MISARAGAFYSVREVLYWFQQLGCMVNVAEFDIKLEGGDTLNFRYLLNPRNATFVPLTDLSDSDSVSEAELESWERVLDLKIPRKRSTH